MRISHAMCTLIFRALRQKDTTCIMVKNGKVKLGNSENVKQCQQPENCFDLEHFSREFAVIVVCLLDKLETSCREQFNFLSKQFRDSLVGWGVQGVGDVVIGAEMPLTLPGK